MATTFGIVTSKSKFWTNFSHFKKVLVVTKEAREQGGVAFRSRVFLCPIGGHIYVWGKRYICFGENIYMSCQTGIDRNSYEVRTFCPKRTNLFVERFEPPGNKEPTVWGKRVDCFGEKNRLFRFSPARRVLPNLISSLLGLDIKFVFRRSNQSTDTSHQKYRYFCPEVPILSKSAPLSASLFSSIKFSFSSMKGVFYFYSNCG